MKCRFSDNEISSETIRKDGVDYASIMIKIPETEMGLNIYPEKIFDDMMQQGYGISDEAISPAIIPDLINCLEADLKERLSSDICSRKSRDEMLQKIKDYNYILSHVIPVLTNKNIHKGTDSYPHIDICGDLRVIYKIVLEVNADNGIRMCTTVTDNIKDSWTAMWGDTKVSRIFHQAFLNDQKVNPEQFMSMMDVFCNSMKANTFGVSKDALKEVFSGSDFHVITNSYKIEGAVKVITSPTVKDYAREHGGCYVIPSSIHEAMLFPKDKDFDADDMKNFIPQVNSSKIEPEDVLSDILYELDETGKLKVAE